MVNLTAVKTRLKMLGYEVIEDDTDELEYYIEKAESKFKSELNRTVLPEELSLEIADAAAGFFLSEREASGRLDGFDTERAVKSITEGDTTVTYTDDITPKVRFDSLIKALTTIKPGTVSAYRRMAW